MNKSNAYNELEALVSSYKTKFETVGVCSKYEVYFLNAQHFKEVAADEAADSVCASITLSTSQGDEECCGFDISVDIDSCGEVDEKSLSESIEAFSKATDEFLEKIATSEKKDEVIREAAKREAALLQANIDTFNSEIKKLQTKTIVLATVAIVIIFIAVFAFIAK